MNEKQNVFSFSNILTDYSNTGVARNFDSGGPKWKNYVWWRFSV